jgi:hypothetical protein
MSRSSSPINLAENIEFSQAVLEMIRTLQSPETSQAILEIIRTLQSPETSQTILETIRTLQSPETSQTTLEMIRVLQSPMMKIRMKIFIAGFQAKQFISQEELDSAMYELFIILGSWTRKKME